MVKAEDRIKQEQERVAHYLHSSTEEKLLRVCDQQLLEVPEAALLEKENSGCEALLRDNKTDDLSRMYRLFARIATGLTPIGNIVRKHIQDVGLALVKGQTAKPDDKETDLMPYVQQLLDIHDKYTELVGTGPEKGCFQGHTIFHKAMKEAFEVFVNKDIGKTTTAELLSQFCDNLLKKSGERLSDEALEDKLEKVVKLFSYLSDKVRALLCGLHSLYHLPPPPPPPTSTSPPHLHLPSSTSPPPPPPHPLPLRPPSHQDIFAEFYKKQLAKRLLLARSSSDDAERSMIGKLKLRCGAQVPRPAPPATIHHHLTATTSAITPPRLTSSLLLSLRSSPRSSRGW